GRQRHAAADAPPFDGAEGHGLERLPGAAETRAQGLPLPALGEADIARRSLAEVEAEGEDASGAGEDDGRGLGVLFEGTRDRRELAHDLARERVLAVAEIESDDSDTAFALERDGRCGHVDLP